MVRHRFRFVHAADLHVDSPLRGLEDLDEAPVERLRAATRAAMENLVSLCISEQVEFLIVAGDVFDGPWQDMRTGLWTARQFRRLEAAGIEVYLLRGNHDAESKVRQALPWPENVKEFPVNEPGTYCLEALEVALHGQGFAEPAILDDLAANYPAPRSGYFNIGVLHTSLTGDANHDTYAATSPQLLAARGYDYWALGHVHARQIISQHPWIVFPGNTQGRHIRECGPKGCMLVTVSDKTVERVEFVATDVLRWEQAVIDATTEMSLAQLQQSVGDTLAALQSHADGRLLATRLLLRGPCEAHWELVEPGRREEFAAQLRDIAARLQDVWIERVVFDTAAPMNVEQLRRGQDLLGDLLRAVGRAMEDDDALRQLATTLQPLADKAPLELRQAGIELSDQRQLKRWLKEAEGLLVGLLAQPVRET